MMTKSQCAMVSLILSSAIVLGGCGEEQDKLFLSLDSDADGQITLAEAGDSRVVAMNFDRIDTDGNGSLNEQELVEAKRSLPSDEEMNALTPEPASEETSVEPLASQPLTDASADSSDQATVTASIAGPAAQQDAAEPVAEPVQ